MPGTTKQPSSTPQSGIQKPSRGKLRTAEILQVASELFLEHGYDNTSVDDIIHIAGGSKAHVYRKFGGKENLFLACIEYLCDEVQLTIETLDVSGLPPETGLHILAQELVGILLGERHIAFQRLVFAQAARFPKAGEIWFRRGPQTTSQTFRRAILRWMQSGELRPGNAGLWANLICDMLSGHLLDRTWLGIGKKPSASVVKNTTDAVVQLFLDGLRAREAK